MVKISNELAESLLTYYASNDRYSWRNKDGILDAMPELSDYQKKLTSAYARTLTHIELLSSPISFQRALAAKERMYRNNAEIHLDYIASSAGYWPLWAEKPKFSSQVFASWLACRTFGELGFTWVCRMQNKGYPREILITLNQSYEATIRTLALSENWNVISAVIPKELGHSIYGNKELIKALLGIPYPVPVSVLAGELPHIERWDSIKYITTISPEPLVKIIKDLSVSSYIRTLGDIALSEIEKLPDSETISTLLYLSTSLEEPVKGLGAKVTESLVNAFIELMDLEENSLDIKPPNGGAPIATSSRAVSGGKIIIVTTAQQKENLRSTIPHKEDPLDYIIGLTNAFSSHATIPSLKPSFSDTEIYTLKFPYLSESWWVSLMNLMSPLAEAGMSVVGAFLLEQDRIRTLSSQDGTIKVIDSLKYNLPESLNAEILDLRSWTQAYDMLPLPPGKIEP